MTRFSRLSLSLKLLLIRSRKGNTEVPERIHTQEATVTILTCSPSPIDEKKILKILVITAKTTWQLTEK